MRNDEPNPEQTRELGHELPDNYTEDLDRYARCDEKMFPLIDGSFVGTTEEFKRLVQQAIGPEVALNARFRISAAR